MKLGHSFMDGSRGQTWFVAMVESGILYFAFWVRLPIVEHLQHFSLPFRSLAEWEFVLANRSLMQSCSLLGPPTVPSLNTTSQCGVSSPSITNSLWAVLFTSRCALFLVLYVAVS